MVFSCGGVAETSGDSIKDGGLGVMVLDTTIVNYLQLNGGTVEVQVAKGRARRSHASVIGSFPLAYILIRR